MSTSYGAGLVTDGIASLIDASNIKSYPGAGTSITDMIGTEDYTLTSGAVIATVDSVECFDVSASARRLVGSSAVTFGSEHTLQCWARPLSDATAVTWRTLWRTDPEDHPILIQDGTNVIGYYDNSASTFRSYGLNIGTIGMENKWTMFTVVASAGTSTLYINDNQYSGSVAYSADGGTLLTIGGWSSSQPFGYIANNIAYTRALSVAEINQNFQALRGRFGL